MLISAYLIYITYVFTDSILFPDVPIALRLSSHLLLGVVRIYNKKVNYLFDDCSEALLKVKQAFRSTAVDLPPEESKAPYHSITLPEKFDLDDFELPDSDIFQGFVWIFSLLSYFIYISIAFKYFFISCALVKVCQLLLSRPTSFSLYTIRMQKRSICSRDVIKDPSLNG